MTYLLLFKRYAPFKSFGFGFSGDSRSTASFFGTARIWAAIMFEFDTRWVPITSVWSDPTHHSILPTATGQPKLTMSSYSYDEKKDSISINAHAYGANPSVPGSPDIDTYLSATLTRNEGLNQVTISGSLKGDKFPNAEVFITPITPYMPNNVWGSSRRHYTARSSVKNFWVSNVGVTPVCVANYMTLGGASLGPTGLMGANKNQLICMVKGNCKL